MKLFLLVVVTFFGLDTFADKCATDTWFKEEGWSIHSTDEFTTTALTLEKRTKESTVKDDMETEFDSDLYQKSFHFRSWDDLSTLDTEMYGDIVFISEPLTHKLIELRWYEDGRKHLVYRENECAMDLIPLATNTLF